MCPRIERVHDLWILRHVVLLEVESWGGINVHSIDKLRLNKECRLFSWGFSLGSEGWARRATHFNPKLGVRFLLCKRGRRNDAALCLLKEVSLDHRKEDEWVDRGSIQLNLNRLFNRIFNRVFSTTWCPTLI